MLYVRFPLSLRNVEDLLHERGIDISHETVRFWWNRFGPMFAAEIRRKRVERMRSFPHWRWHLDEVFVKINGEQHYLWRAVDHEGEVLESFVTKRRQEGRIEIPEEIYETSRSRRGDRDGLPPLLWCCAARNSASAIDRKPVAGSTIARRIHISRFDDGNGPCSASGGCEVCRNSPPSTPRSTTISTRNAASPAGTFSRPTAPPLSPSGAVLARHKGQLTVLAETGSN